MAGMPRRRGGGRYRDLRHTHLRYVVVNDSGRVINPMMVEGQLTGGAAHGIGNALFEWMGYDDEAQPITTTLPTISCRARPRCPGSR